MSATARVLARALEAPPETDPTAERILDGALRVAAAAGLRRLTIDDVAVRAGVGRMTVYRRFGSREELVEALTARECRRCLGRLAESLHPEAPILERTVALFATVLEVIDEHPLLARLARVEPEALLDELSRPGSEVVELLSAFLIGQITAGQTRGELPAGDPALLAELGIRVGASFVLMPVTALPRHDRAATEAALRGLLGPLLAAR